jgi:hypothetical protein
MILMEKFDVKKFVSIGEHLKYFLIDNSESVSIGNTLI